MLLLSLLLLSLAFPLPGWSGLAWVAGVPLILALASERRWSRARVWGGVLGAVLWWVWMLRWLEPVTVPGWLGLSVYCAAWWVGTVWVIRRITRPKLPRHRIRSVLLAGLLLATLLPLTEWLRGVWPAGGFGWFALGHTQPAGRVGWLASVGGVPLVSGALLIFATAVAASARAWSGRSSLRVRAATALVAAAAAVALLVPLPDPPPGNTLRVAAIQTDTPHSNKLAPTAELLRSDWQDLRDLHALAVLDGDVVLVVWPETTTPGPLGVFASGFDDYVAGVVDDPDTRALYAERALGRRRVLDAVEQGGVPVVAGSADTRRNPDPDAAQDDRFNTVFLVQPDGVTAADLYDKVHLVPFGEYIPGPAWLKRLVLERFSPYDFDYSISRGTRSGAAGVTEVVPGWRAGFPVCFEDTDAGLCRRLVAGGADVLINVTNDGWFGFGGFTPGTYLAGGMRQQHLQIAAFRAAENGVPLVRSVNTGVSAIINPRGDIVAANPAGRAGVVTASIRRPAAPTLYTRGGWWITLVSLAGLAAGALVLIIRSRRSTVRPDVP